LPKGQFLAAARKHQSGVYEIRPLTQIGHDSRGYDLATASVEFDAEDQAWPLYPGNCEWGMSIWSWGYPLSLKEEKPDGNTALRIYPRFLRGYVTRRFLGDPPTFPQVELDMQCPPGLSGAPIVYEGTDKVLGLVFAHNNTEIGGHPVYHYGYAFDRELLDGLAGPATNGLPLGKVLA
jgi:hypothetical protein